MGARMWSPAWRNTALVTMAQAARKCEHTRNRVLRTMQQDAQAQVPALPINRCRFGRHAAPRTGLAISWVLSRHSSSPELFRPWRSRSRPPGVSRRDVA